jgi:hypothetical protein
VVWIPYVENLYIRAVWLMCVYVVVYVISVDNGLNPVWFMTIEADVINPPLAFVRFVVFDEDMFGEPNFIGHAIFPMGSLRTGNKIYTIVYRPSSSSVSISSSSSLLSMATFITIKLLRVKNNFQVQIEKR